MNRKMLKSALRHLLGAMLTAVAATLESHPSGEVTLLVYGSAIVAAVVPVLVKYLDPEETDYGRTPPPE